MNRALALLLAALALLMPGTPVLAQAGAHSGARVVATVSWVEEWDPVRGEWVRIDENPASLAEPIMPDPVRFIARPSLMAEAAAGALAQYGPFRVLDDKRAALVGSTDVASPRAFKAMLAALQTTAGERRYDSAVLRTLGATRTQLRGAVLVECVPEQSRLESAFREAVRQ